MPMTTVLTRNVPRYHAARRRPMAWRKRSVHLEDISGASHRVDQLAIEAAIDLLAQPRHQHVDDVGAGVERVSPDVRQDHGLRQYAPRVAHQVFEQRELARPQFDELSSALDP